MPRGKRISIELESVDGRGPWLSAIWDGASNTSMLMKATSAAYPTAVKILGKLETDGLIRNASKNMRPHYILSDWGEQEYRRFKSGTSEKPGKRPEDRPVLTATERETPGARTRRQESGTLGKSQPKPEQFPEGFDDKFNCSMCSMKGALCDMHARYVRDQEAKPPAPAISAPTPPPAPSVPAGVKATEQIAGQFRVVQIKVGEVIITIKEPYNAAL